MAAMVEVTVRQQRFVDALDTAPSLAAAARAAGYAASDVHVASVQGSQVLASAGVQHALALRRESLAASAGIDPRSVLARIEARAAGGAAGEVPHAVRQRADETLVGILALREQTPLVDARSLTLSVTSADVRAD